MSYKNIYFDKEENTMHVWDNERGYYTKKNKRYAYLKDRDGEFTSIYGDKLKKVNYWKDIDNDQLFESDVSEVTRFLIDEYGDTDEVSKEHCVLTFDIEVEMNSGLPDTHEANNEITAIAFYDTVSKNKTVYVLSPDKEINKRIKNADVRSFNSEADLLIAFLNKWVEISPTIVTGWNIDYFDVMYLYNRLCNVLGKTEANRLSPIGKVSYNKFRKRFIIAGVSCLDYMALFKNFTYTEYPNYRLDTIATLELGRGKIEYEGNLDQLFRDDIEKFIEYNLVDVELVVDLDKKLQLIELARAICHAGHVGYEDFLFSSIWLEGAILTFLRRRGLVAPNKPHRFNFKIRKQALKGSSTIKVEKIPPGLSEQGKLKIWKSPSSHFLVSYIGLDYEQGLFILQQPLKQIILPKYILKIDFEGAYVKEPEPGLYKWVFDLDLTSLYPSIIMSLNISPEKKMGKVLGYSVENHMANEIDKYVIIDTEGNRSPEMNKVTFNEFNQNAKLSVSSNGILYNTENIGVIPEILSVWFEQRVEYRKSAKQYGQSGDDELYAFYDQRQLVQKIMLNSLYGVLGLPSFRFYDLDNASAVTSTGQSIIKTTSMIANNYYTAATDIDKDYTIYIDTDSVFYSAIPLVKARNPEIDLESDEQMIPAILDVAKEVQNHLNKTYDVMAKSMFNVDDHRFDIKQETIAKSAFWVSKKRYAQWIINDNGVNCDKMDVKGLDVRRSSFPVYFKEVMNTVLWDILKDTKKTEIDGKILAYKDGMPDQHYVTIAKNSAVKGMSGYEFKDQAIGEFQKGTPAHVKAALTYNQLLIKFDAAFKYEPMKDGDKIKWVYLTPNTLGLESVALTGYSDPDQILDFIQKYIDYDLLWKSELNKKLVEFYNALKWEQPNPNLKLASNFFEF